MSLLTYYKKIFSTYVYNMHSKEHKKPRENCSCWILLPEQMEALSKKPYLYNASAGSYLELMFLQKFWTWLVKIVPTRIAPCVLTCMGLAINLSCCFTLMYYSADKESSLISEIPSWIFLLCALGVFLYQTLDALDGKQAIKVQNTQIEEIYDHGCDAISTVFVALTTAIACQLMDYPFLMFSFFIASMLAFYTTHWQDHVTHVMIFGKIDVSEAQFLVMLIHIITAFYGQQIWKFQLFTGIEFRVLMCIMTLFSLSLNSIANLGYVLGNKTPLDDYIQIPRKTGSQIWNPVVPVTILTIFAIRAFYVGLFRCMPYVFFIAFGFAYAKLTMKLVMTNVTYADMDIWDSSLLAPLLLFLDTFVEVIPLQTGLLCGLVYNLMDAARYFTYVSWDMREALDVWIFSLKYFPGHPKCRNGNLGIYVNGLNNGDILANTSKSSFPKKYENNAKSHISH